MLSVSKLWRKRGIGTSCPQTSILSSPIVLRYLVFLNSCCPTPLSSTASALVRNSIQVMKEHGVDEVRESHSQLIVHRAHAHTLTS